MVKQKAVCPKCGTHFEIEDDAETAECPFCKEKIVFGEKSRTT